jgi:EmrB/QacA subfamily drug resistance transporter
MNAPASTPTPLTRRDIRFILSGVLLSMFLGSLEQTIVAPSLPLMARDLGGVRDMAWIATSYLLMATAVTPLYGKASDVYGRHRTMLIAIIVFVIGAVACALAPTMLALVLARGVQGLGGGGLMSLGQIVIADVIAPKERGRYQAWVAGTFTTSALVGPILGGFLSQHFHWTAIFWINLPLGCVAFFLTNTLLRKLPRYDRPHRLDIVGALLMTGATTAMLLALNSGGEWTALGRISQAIGALVLWVLFAYRLRHAPEPLVPLRVLDNAIIRRVTISSALGYGTIVALTIYVPLYLQRVMHLSPTSAGAALTPLVLGTIIGTLIAGQVTSRVDRYKRLPLVGLSVAAATLLIIAALVPWLPAAGFITLITASSMALGLLFPVAIVMVQNAADRQDLGVATATMNFFRQLAAAVFVAVYGAIVVERGSPHNGASAFRLVFAFAALTTAASFIAFSTAEQVPLRVGAGAAKR